MGDELRRAGKYILAIGIVVIFAFAYLIPVGVKGSEPQADITVYITDVGTGDTFSSTLTVGEPSNSLSFKKTDKAFKPLTEYTQNVVVYASHNYLVYASVTFRYSGERIDTYNLAYARFSAKTNDGRACLNFYQVAILAGTALTDTNIKLNTTYDGIPTSPMIIVMAHTGILGTPNQWSVVATMGITNWLDSDVGLTGALLDSCRIYVDVKVEGTASDGTPVRGTVSATLRLICDFQTEGGTISVVVDGMSAGITGD